LRMPYQRVEAFRVRMDVEYQGPKQLKLPWLPYSSFVQACGSCWQPAHIMI
jgi:hypothetical protein